MTKLKIILIIFGINAVLLSIYFVSHKKENISLAQFYRPASLKKKHPEQILH